MKRTLVLTVAAAGLAITILAMPAIAKAGKHIMMQPTAKYGQGFLGFSTKASDCMDLMLQAARSDTHDDRYYTKQYIGCLAG